MIRVKSYDQSTDSDGIGDRQVFEVFVIVYVISSRASDWLVKKKGRMVRFGYSIIIL